MYGLNPPYFGNVDEFICQCLVVSIRLGSESLCCRAISTEGYTRAEGLSYPNSLACMGNFTTISGFYLFLIITLSNVFSFHDQSHG